MGGYDVVVARRRPALNWLGMSDADQDTWRLWSRLYPILLIAAAGIILLERGHTLIAGPVLLVAIGLGVRVAFLNRSD